MADPRPLNALLGQGARYQGTLSFEGRVRVDGEFHGTITTDDLLEIGLTGSVEGEIDAAEVVVAGSVDGTLRARESLRLEATARVAGRVEATRMHVEPGARIEATVEVG